VIEPDISNAIDDKKVQVLSQSKKSDITGLKLDSYSSFVMLTTTLYSRKSDSG
jgi:hypothetical protein